MWFLQSFGVISMNSIIQVVVHFVRKFLSNIIDVQNTAYIQYDLY